MDRYHTLRKRLSALDRWQGWGNEYRLLIVYKGAVVGATGISDLDSPNKAGEMGYWLAEDMQGRGIVTRTCRALLNYAFDELEINRMHTCCHRKYEKPGYP